MSAAQQVRFVGFRIDAAGGGEARLLPWRHLHPDAGGHVPRYLSLHSQHVAQIELVRLCPEMAFRRHLNQVGRDADPLSGVEHGAFQNRLHLQLLRNLTQWLRALPVADHGLIGEHLQGADLAQFGDQRLRHAIREVVLLGVAGEVLQWQYGDGSDVACSWSADHLVAQSADIQPQEGQGDQKGENDDASCSMPTPPRGGGVTNLRGVLQTTGDCNREGWCAVYRGGGGGGRYVVHRDGSVDDECAVHRVDEAVPPPGQGLDEARGVGGVA